MFVNKKQSNIEIPLAPSAGILRHYHGHSKAMIPVKDSCGPQMLTGSVVNSENLASPHAINPLARHDREGADASQMQLFARVSRFFDQVVPQGMLFNSRRDGNDSEFALSHSRSDLPK